MIIRTGLDFAKYFRLLIRKALREILPLASLGKKINGKFGICFDGFGQLTIIGPIGRLNKTADASKHERLQKCCENLVVGGGQFQPGCVTIIPDLDGFQVVQSLRLQIRRHPRTGIEPLIIINARNLDFIGSGTPGQTNDDYANKRELPHFNPFSEDQKLYLGRQLIALPG